MIEAIQGRDYTLKKMYKAMALKLYGKPLKNCNEHEKNEVRIQVAAKIKNNKKETVCETAEDFIKYMPGEKNDVLIWDESGESPIKNNKKKQQEEES